mgnify:CR=1 FL=1
MVLLVCIDDDYKCSKGVDENVLEINIKWVGVMRDDVLVHA